MATTLKMDMVFPEGMTKSEQRKISVNKHMSEAQRQVGFLAVQKLGGFTIKPVVESAFNTDVIEWQGNTRNAIKKANPELVKRIKETNGKDKDAQAELERIFIQSLDASYEKNENGLYVVESTPTTKPKVIAAQSVEDMEAKADEMEAELERLRASIQKARK